MRLLIKPAHKDYIFIETDMDLSGTPDAVVIYLDTIWDTYAPNGACYTLYLVKSEWWKANKKNLLYENRIKIA